MRLIYFFYFLVCLELLIWPGCWCEHVVSCCLLGLLSPATTTPESRLEWPESPPFQSLFLSQNSNMPNWIAQFISSGTKPDQCCSSHRCCYSNMKAVLDLHFVLSMTCCSQFRYTLGFVLLIYNIYIIFLCTYFHDFKHIQSSIATLFTCLLNTVSSINSVKMNVGDPIPLV